jgi:hypothetical protein
MTAKRRILMICPYCNGIGKVEKERPQHIDLKTGEVRYQTDEEFADTGIFYPYLDTNNNYGIMVCVNCNGNGEIN